MYIVYFVYSEKLDKYYTGYTSDLDKRISYHNAGKNRSTKNGAPWVIVHTEEYESKSEAWKREQQIKRYKGGEAFKKLLS